MAILKNAESEEIDKEWKNYCVIDDSSKFAAAVYYHYINKEILKDEKQENRTAYDIDLWGTSSTMYLDLNSFTKKILKDKKFEIIPYDKIASNAQNISLSKFEPKTGDLLCREGHVEFFITKNKTISWGRVHKDFLIIKEYKREKRGLVSSHPEDKNMPVTTIIRFTGGNSNEK